MEEEEKTPDPEGSPGGEQPGEDSADATEGPDASAHADESTAAEEPAPGEEPAPVEEAPVAADSAAPEKPAEEAAEKAAVDAAEAPTAETSATDEPTENTGPAAADVAEEPVADAQDEPTVVQAAAAKGGPAAARADTLVGDRRVLAGVGAVIAALAIGAVGYAIGDSSSSSEVSPFDGSPVAYVHDLSARNGDSFPAQGDCPGRG
jgi:hypothetical protein